MSKKNNTSDLRSNQLIKHKVRWCTELLMSVGNTTEPYANIASLRGWEPM